MKRSKILAKSKITKFSICWNEMEVMKKQNKFEPNNEKKKMMQKKF